MCRLVCQLVGCHFEGGFDDGGSDGVMIGVLLGLIMECVGRHFDIVRNAGN